MMPGIDGWELLQRLRTAGTEFIPSLFCSVINDPELAFALGASQMCPACHARSPASGLTAAPDLEVISMNNLSASWLNFGPDIISAYLSLRSFAV